jgi:hypothetical protein
MTFVSEPFTCVLRGALVARISTCHTPQTLVMMMCVKFNVPCDVVGILRSKADELADRSIDFTDPNDWAALIRSTKSLEKIRRAALVFCRREPLEPNGGMTSSRTQTPQ